jgi:hypothetical protein
MAAPPEHVQTGTPPKVTGNTEIKPSEPKVEERTSEYYKVSVIPERFDHPNWFKGYGSNEHPLYRTSNNTYGSKSPSVHTMPTSYHGRSQKFTASMGLNYRSHSLNTSMDKTVVNN